LSDAPISDAPTPPKFAELVAARPRPRFTLHGKKNHLVCYLWGGEIKPPGFTGIVCTLGDWKDERDGAFCERIRQETEFGVHSPDPYFSSFEWSEKEGRNIPTEFVKRFYEEARKGGYKSVDIVGFSGGGAIAASSLAHHSDKKDAGMVKSLVIISGPIAERGQHGDQEKDKFTCIPHTDAAFYAENIKAITLLIYGDQDFLRDGVAEWKKRTKENQVKESYYHGDHDFGKNSENFVSVTDKIIEFLKNSPDQGPRVAPLARRKRPKRKRTKKHRKTGRARTHGRHRVVRPRHRKTG